MQADNRKSDNRLGWQDQYIKTEKTLQEIK